MKIRELFAKDVTRPIAPVVYFHESAPEKLQTEVREYIVTGGWPPNDPRASRSKEGGIHEELVRLLRNIRAQMDAGVGEPASWISGYYGSGKSSFAKLLGLSLDGRKLPDGTPLVDAFLARDESPAAPELRAAWSALVEGIKPIAVTFDIGSKSNTGEHVHTAILRQVQEHFGYCKKQAVADFELALEVDGHYDRFLEAAERALKRPWSAMKDTRLADSHFSHAMHALDPERYREPTSWLDAPMLTDARDRTDSSSAVHDIAAMLRMRRPGRTLFIVVDEVSQYVHDSNDRMLKLQSFVSELGAHTRGQVFLLATGQQKLDDAAGLALSKLKDRFPSKLRVHLSSANIRDVVHQRLLKKTQAASSRLAEEFDTHRADLRLYAYGCEEITDEDFVDVYPLLPKHIDLLLQITSAIRASSTRAQGDAREIRGLLQLLVALFTEHGLAERDLGELVALDVIYDVLHTGLDNDSQLTMTRLLEDCARANDPLGARAAKAVALLELIQRDDVQTEESRTTAKLVARCLYDRLGRGDLEPQVTASLERLRAAGHLTLSEKTGYRLQSSAGQEWQNERDRLLVPPDQVSTSIQEILGRLMGDVDRPKLGSRALPWLAFFSDGRHVSDARVARSTDDAAITVDFRWALGEPQPVETWLRATHPENGTARERLVWVAGNPGRVVEIAMRLGRSEHMFKRNDAKKSSLSDARKWLLRQEQGLVEELARELKIAVAESFLAGSFYFAGRAYPAKQEGSSFSTALHGFAERRLKELFPLYVDLAILEGELVQLLQPTLQGPSNKFFEKGLGLLSMDAGKVIPTCDGQVPRRMLEVIKTDAGLSGSALLAALGKPPCGYAQDIVRATALGLLRAGKVRIEADGGTLTDVRDPGTQSVFTGDRDFRRASFYPALDEALTQKDRNAICKLLEKYLPGAQPDRENGPIADVVHDRFGAQRERLRQIERRFVRLPGQRAFPAKLERLAQALEHCRRSREVEPTVKTVKANLDVLRDGFEALGRFETDLSDAALDALVAADGVLKEHATQLEAVGAAGTIAEDQKLLREHLAGERPWIEAQSLAGPVERVRASYQATRTELLGEQERAIVAAIDALKRRSGYERLTPDDARAVLGPIRDAAWDTSADAVAPRLDQLRDGFAKRLDAGVEESNRRLDAKLEEVDDKPVVPIELKLRGVEIETREQLAALLRTIEQRILPQLEAKKRVRIG